MTSNSNEWRIDPERSSLRFTLRHIVVHQIQGRFGRWAGTISFDEANPTRSAVVVAVDLGSVETGDAERDAHLRSNEFFDVATNPQAKFVSTDVRLVAEGKARVRGRLAMCGIERYVELEIVSYGKRPGEAGADRIACTVKAHVDRREFGLRWNQDLDVGGIVVADDIEIVAEVEAMRVMPASLAPSGRPSP